MIRWWIPDLAVFVVAAGLATFLLGESTAASAVPQLPFLHPLFCDHMVLQRDRPVPVWGWTKPCAKIMVQMLGQTVTGQAGQDGRWEVMVGPYPAGGPHVLTIHGPQSVTLSDVLVGDVWVCSGQSNMQMGIAEARNAKDEIAAADNPQIRLCSVPMHIAFQPERTIDLAWSVCTPASVSTGGWGGFSAAGYYFGRALQQELKIPIGLIHASWGGTVAEAWVSRVSLGKLPDFVKPLEEYDRDLATWSKGAAAYEEALAAWWKAHDPGSVTPHGWESPMHDDADWKSMTLPTKWEDAGLPDFDGVVWSRRTIIVPPSWAGHDLALHLGKIDDRDVTFVNGTRVGGLDNWEADRHYTVPGRLVQANHNVIAVRVLDTGGAGGLYGPAEDMWIAPANAGPVERIAITGPWRYRATADLSKHPIPQPMDQNPNRVTVLSNGMIEPLIPFGIKGAIWYQGESNVGRAEQYARLLPALIGDWRARFRSGEFPFLIVQLANFTDPPAEPGDDAWAELREAQAKVAATLPGAGLAVAIDIGEAKDIHPKNKQEVGRRLALAALHGTYGRTTEWSGPVFRSMTVTGGAARVSFDHAAGLKTADGSPVKGFAVAGAAGPFVWADAKVDGDAVVVSSPKVSAPVTVRYAWAANPVCNLVNGAGLPAVPFRTDAKSAR